MIDGYGQNPQGLLIYAENGMMSAQMMKSGRAPFSSPRETSLQAEYGSPDEIVAAFNSYVSYCGRFTFDEETSQVNHRVEVALVPEMVGRTISRKVEIDGDCLTLRAPSLTFEGVKSDVVVQWHRADGSGVNQASEPLTGYQIMRRYLDAIVAKDIQAISDLHTEDVVLEYPFAPEGHPQRFEGHKDVVGLFAASFKAKNPRAYTDLEVLPTADGTGGVVKFNGELELPDTGEIYRNSYFAFVQFRDNKIAVFREYYDAAVRAAKDPMRAKQFDRQKQQA